MLGLTVVGLTPLGLSSVRVFILRLFLLFFHKISINFPLNKLFVFTLSCEVSGEICYFLSYCMCKNLRIFKSI